ncbi:MAG: hypothetical protein JNL58_32330 [Planctomyces sp.]|nr:hypothetical protein [Planctomyces sp.]
MTISLRAYSTLGILLLLAVLVIFLVLRGRGVPPGIVLMNVDEIALSVADGSDDHEISPAFITANPTSATVAIGTYYGNALIADFESRSITQVDLQFSGSAIAWSPDGAMLLGKNVRQYSDPGPFCIYLRDSFSLNAVAETSESLLLAQDAAWISKNRFAVAEYFRPELVREGERRPITVYRVEQDERIQQFKIVEETSIEHGSFCDQIESLRFESETVLISNSKPPSVWAFNERNDRTLQWRRVAEFSEYLAFTNVFASRSGTRVLFGWNRTQAGDNVLGPLVDVKKRRFLSAFELGYNPQSGKHLVKSLWEVELPPVEYPDDGIRPGVFAISGDDEFAVVVSKDANLILDMETGEVIGTLSGHFVCIDTLTNEPGIVAVTTDLRVVIIKKADH